MYILYPRQINEMLDSLTLFCDCISLQIMIRKQRINLCAGLPFSWRMQSSIHMKNVTQENFRRYQYLYELVHAVPEEVCCFCIILLSFLFLLPLFCFVLFCLYFC